MSQQQRLIQLPLVGAILLCLLAAVCLAAYRRIAKPGSPDKIARHKVDTSADDALNYWTADKMRDARPADMPNSTDIKRRKRRPRRPPDSSSPRESR